MREERRLALKTIDKDLVLKELRFRNQKLTDLIKQMETGEIPYDPIAYDEFKDNKLEVEELIYILENNEETELSLQQKELAREVAMGAIAERIAENN